MKKCFLTTFSVICMCSFAGCSSIILDKNTPEIFREERPEKGMKLRGVSVISSTPIIVGATKVDENDTKVKPTKKSSKEELRDDILTSVKSLREYSCRKTLRELEIRIEDHNNDIRRIFLDFLDMLYEMRDGILDPEDIIFWEERALLEFSPKGSFPANNVTK